MVKQLIYNNLVCFVLPNNYCVILLTFEFDSYLSKPSLYMWKK